MTRLASRANTSPAGSVSSASPLIRAATAADLSAIERLLADANLPNVGVADSLETFVVAELTGPARALVGVAGLELCRENALLRSVAVRRDWRGKALGRALVQRLLTEAERRRIRALYLLTTTAQEYFPKFGFGPVSREEVPADIRATEEFRHVCSATATVMVRQVGHTNG